MNNPTVTILPPVMRDERGLAFAAAVDAAIDIDTWLACPLAVEHAPDIVLWELARQFDVAGPLIQAMRTRSQKERLLKNALLLQKKRGTPWSVEELMRLLGYTDAKVLDRVAMERLNYDAEAEHDGMCAFDAAGGEVKPKRYRGDTVHNGNWGGTHVFNGVRSYYRYEWTDYRIRLYIDADSRPFGAVDRAEALKLAEEWAPLRATLIGWDARHVLSSRVANPDEFAARVSGIVLEDSEGNRYLAPCWSQSLDGGAVALRWRLWSEDLPLRDVCAVGIVSVEAQIVEWPAMPSVVAAENVIYEGIWRLEAA